MRQQRAHGRRWIYLSRGVALITALIATTSVAYAAGAGEGLTEGQIVRTAGIAAVLVAILLLVLTEFVFRRRVSRSTYHWSMLVALLLLPSIGLLGGITTVFDETKTVASCSTCHVMHTFVNDMQDPESATLAARHFENRWIPSNQCYACHTTYGIHGTAESKRDGLRHWLLYVTRTYPEVIRFRGSYPNSNCLGCHSGTPIFNVVASHKALEQRLQSDEVACISCHGPPHPTPPERPAARRAP
jgi:cytochrome c nitrite reductase small subunit